MTDKVLEIKENLISEKKKELIFPVDSERIPELIRFIENDPKFSPEKYTPNLESIIISMNTKL